MYFPSFASTNFCLRLYLLVRIDRYQIYEGGSKIHFHANGRSRTWRLWFVHTRTPTRRRCNRAKLSALVASQNLFPRRFVHGLQGCLSKPGYECHVAERNEYFVHVATTSRNFISARNTAPKYSYFLSPFRPRLTLALS